MTALITVETILLALVSVLVVGLLRSHAEILRRLEASEPRSARPGSDPSLPPARPGATRAFDVAGTTLGGDPIKIAVTETGHDTMLAFLSSGCVPCRQFWQGLSRGVDLPRGARVVVVTKDPAYESSAKLLELAPPETTLVMSSAAWDAYGVQGSPYFIHVDGRQDRVVGEGTAADWSQVASLVNDALADRRLSDARTGRDSTPARLARADRELNAAGIGPGDPSLYVPRPPAGSSPHGSNGGRGPSHG
jgi:hypothetical protein